MPGIRAEGPLSGAGKTKHIHPGLEEGWNEKLASDSEAAVSNRMSNCRSGRILNRRAVLPGCRCGLYKAYSWLLTHSHPSLSLVVLMAVGSMPNPDMYASEMSARVLSMLARVGEFGKLRPL